MTDMGEEKKGFFSRLREGLTKTRNNIVHGIDSVFSGFSTIDDDFYEELEEILIMGDIGVKATGEIWISFGNRSGKIISKRLRTARIS